MYDPQDLTEQEIDDMLNKKLERSDEKNEEKRLAELEQAHNNIARARIINRIQREVRELHTDDAESHIWFNRFEEMVLEELKP